MAPPPRPAPSARGGLPRVLALGRRWAPHTDLYHQILRLSWGQFFLLTALVFFGLNLSFAGAYHLAPGSVVNTRQGSFLDHFFFSVQTFATIGYGAMAPATTAGHVLVSLEAFLGMLTTAIVTGLTFARFARPTARVIFSHRCVVTRRDGVPHLMVRMANQRQNQIVEATLRAALLLTEVTREGDVMRRSYDLTLVRDRTAFFWLTWTAMHRIDETSPFYGDDALERLRRADAELYLSLSGLDETLSQTVHARFSYGLEDIVWDARFVDVLQTLPDGTRVIDYRVFHDVVPQPAPALPRTLDELPPARSA